MIMRIGIVDDHQLFRKSLALLIGTFEGVEVVLGAGNGKELLELLPDIPVDLLLLDIQMPEMDGFETCSILRQQYPDIKVLIVSQLNSRESIHKVMELGAHGFFTKNTDPEQLEKALLSIRDKDFYFEQELGIVLKEAMLWEKKKRHIFLSSSIAISDREMEIIRLASEGLGSIQIGKALCIGVRTVETHRKRIIEKTDSKNFIGVILYAFRHGLLLVEDL